MVLVELYRSAEGSRWRRQGRWLSRSPHCSWEGVTCNHPGDTAGVLSLSLPANGLAGTLPQTLVGRCSLKASEPVLKAPMVSALDAAIW